jgi:LacI family transcriptional regulator, galactose operon repressor
VTIADVATRAQVSTTTVSHVLSGHRPVAPATRERVERAIAELGYRPDGVARSLRTHRSHLVSLIVPNIANPYYTALARGLDRGLEAAGYRVVICNTEGDPAREYEFVADMCDRRVDGIVLDSFSASEASIRQVTGRGVPVVWIGAETVDHPGVDTVKADDERGAYEATAHLMTAGRRHIAMIEGTPGSGTPRNDGYRRALDDAGADVDRRLIAHGEWTREGGARAMTALLERTRPDAVFCANDLMAIGALDVLRELGRRVPDDVALAGFDDIDAASMVSPPLTTVANPADGTGSEAARLLSDRMIGGYEGAPQHVVLPCTLVVRASS